MAVKFALLDTVMLDRDAPEHGLRAGDRGAVVELYGRTASRRSSSNLQGRPKALVSLRSGDLRSVALSDVLSVRSV